MSYRCGIGPRLAAVLNMEPGPARLTCDGCGAQRSVEKKGGGAYAWLLKDRAAPGWQLKRQPNRARLDFCSECRQH